MNANALANCDYNKNSVEPDRVLAQVVTVDQITPIDGAQSIELAHVLGWQCVIKKAEFKVGDETIYVSIDAILDPESKLFAFLSGKRLKTKKILNTLSQGLLLAKSCLAEYGIDPSTIKVGDNVTKLLKVRKYVISAELGQYSQAKCKTFPTFVPKTDEERVQNMHKVLSQLPGQEVVITRKEDGTSTTFIYHKPKPTDGLEAGEGVFLVCGRNNVLEKDGDDKKACGHYFEMERKFDVEAKMRALGLNLAIQGETVGPKINGNKLKLKECDFRVFRIWDIDAQFLVPWRTVVELTDKLGLHTVPVIYRGLFKPEWASVKALLNMADEVVYCKDSVAEGIVVATEHGKELPRHSFKVISTKFLLKHNC